MKLKFCLRRFIAAAAGHDEEQVLSPRWLRHLQRCPSCMAEHAKQMAMASRLAATAARCRPLPQLDAVRLTQVALAWGRVVPRRGVPGRLQPVWTMALAALLVALAALLLKRPPDLRPPPRGADGGPSVDALVESAWSWAGEMLREAMLDAELQVLIHDTEMLALTMADEIRAPFAGIASL